MSNVETAPTETGLGTGPGADASAGPAPALPPGPATELLEPREVPLGGPRGLLVRRTLPHRVRRTVGAWCFVDHYGPHSIESTVGMQVPPHPHTGLQTVSWLLEGEVLHRDSLGSVATIRPGELTLMTSGLGIAHSEQSPRGGPAMLHGVQLWAALPGAHRHQSPHFERHTDLPRWRDGDLDVTLILGELDGQVSPARTYSALLGLQVQLGRAGRGRLPLQPTFEHAVLALDAEARVEDVRVPVGSLLYLGTDRTGISIATTGPGRLLLLGGEPLGERLVMWWNFLARDHEEIVAAREDWAAGRRFGEVSGYPGARLEAPALPHARLKPR